MRRIYLLVLLLALAGSVTAQQRWERTYGGLNNDEGFSVQQTSDGGYIITGATWSFSTSYAQVYLIKTDVVGDTLWTRTFGGPSDDQGRSVQQTSDGGYIIAGYTGSFGAGYYDVYLIKTDSSGYTLWTRTFGGTGGDWGYSVKQTLDGGYIIAGSTYSFGAGGFDVYLIKTNANGDTLWTRTYGGTRGEEGYSIQQTLDGGYIIAGLTFSFGAGDDDVYLIKTNANGDTLWTRTYGGALWDYGFSVQQTSDDGFIIVGDTHSFGAGGIDIYVIRTNASGDSLWTRTYGGRSDDEGRSVQKCADESYIITGNSVSGVRGADVYLIKTNTNGDTLWTRTYGGMRSDVGYSVQQTTDGGYVIVGSTYSFGPGSPNYENVYLIKTDANGSSGVEMAGVRGQGLGIRLTAKPNPFTSFASVPGHEAERFSLYDVSGRKVGTYRGDRVGEGLKAGVYFLRAEDGTAKPLRIVKVR